MCTVNLVSVLLLYYLAQEEYVYTDPMTMYRQCNCYLCKLHDMYVGQRIAPVSQRAKSNWHCVKHCGRPAISSRK